MPAQLGEDEAAAEPGLGHIRLQSEGGIAGDQPFVISFQFSERLAPVEMSRGITRIERKSAIEIREGCGVIMDVVECGAAIIEGLGIARVECQCLGEAL